MPFAITTSFPSHAPGSGWGTMRLSVHNDLLQKPSVSSSAWTLDHSAVRVVLSAYAYAPVRTKKCRREPTSRRVRLALITAGAESDAPTLATLSDRFLPRPQVIGEQLRTRHLGSCRVSN